MILKDFQTVGRELFSRGLISGIAGNLSIRMGDRLIITRRGSSMANLEENDLIETGISRNDRATPLASSEIGVHRAIYRHTSALAVVHAHPLHGIALSMVEKEIVPSDNEGQLFAGTVPVLGFGSQVPTGGMADEIGTALKEHTVVMVHAHGSFAIGQLLQDAANATAAFEGSCHMLCILKSLRG
jgi:L-fuculose-phosphate aldolase